MMYNSLFTLLTSLLSLLSHLNTTNACPGHLSARAALDGFTLGSDPPAAPSTLGYTINHFSLIVNDLPAMQQFYGDVLGMRHIFTYKASATYTVVYMGFSHGGKNGTGYQPGSELFNEKNNIEGLIEFVHHASSDEGAPDFQPSTKKANSFSHIGLIVPDILAAQARFEKHGVKIVKRSGELVTWGSPGAIAFGFDKAHSSPKDAAQTIAGINKLGFNEFVMIEDPDGNLLEVQPQVAGQAL